MNGILSDLQKLYVKEPQTISMPGCKYEHFWTQIGKDKI